MRSMTKDCYQGPHFDNSKKILESNNYFNSYNVISNDDSSSDNFLIRSEYEEEFGVNSKEIQLNEMYCRYLSEQKDGSDTIQRIVNHEFLVSYTEKVTFSMQVTPDVDIVPGFSLLALDENGEHITAYCYGREKLWDKNGQIVINLKLMFPRSYDMNVKSVADVLDPFDPDEFKSTYQKALALLTKYIGSEFIDPKKDFIEYVHELMKEWHTNKQDTNLIKDNRHAWRTRATYSDYLNFHSTTGTYDPSNSYNLMPEKLINKWDISDNAAKMDSLQYTYAAHGFQNPKATKDNLGFKPPYDQLNKPGPIEVSTYICGIVNCHNRYLMQIGNNIN